MAALAADRNLLFGLLALQNGLINQGQLVAAFQAWTLDKARALADHLVRRGDLDADQCAGVEAMVGLHLKKHDGDAEKSLAVIPAGRSTRESLAALGDPDIEHSLTQLGSGSDGDADRTASYAVGTATSDGQRFRVLRPHARGGLGAVFVALDTELHREVALKRILDQHADDPAGRQRFLLEAEVTGGLEHPGIVPVYGLGRYADGRPYYAMRFIRGDSLKEAIERFHADASLKNNPGRRSLELRKLLRRFIDVCNAIDYAHSRGVLHRDIKPGNIIVGRHGETLVVDWGLAKATGRSDPAAGERALSPSAASGSAETLPGSALGTPAYMSPEQAGGDLEHLGPRSDVCSLGATLYCLLTGRPPFEGEVADVIRAVQQGGSRPPRQLEPTIDAALEAVCLKAMALRPEDRYGSCRALADDIERWMADEPVTAWREPLSVRTRRWLRRHRTAATAATALLVTAVIALAIGTFTLSQAEERTRKQRDLARQQRTLAEENFRLARQAVDEYFTQVSENTLLNSRVPGMQPVRKDLLRTALRYYREFQTRHGNDADLRAELARACYRIGEINYEIGTTDEALAAYEDARNLGEALVRERPADLTLQSDLAQAARRAGVLLLKRMGRPREGLERLERALAMGESLIRARPEDAEVLRATAACYVDLGYAQTARRLAPDEFVFLQKALAIESRLVQIEPSYRHRYDQARVLEAIGRHYLVSGDSAAAATHCDRAREILEQLHRERPDELDAADNLAWTWLEIGTLRRQTPNTEAALDAFHQARRIYDQLIRDNPAVVRLRVNRNTADCEIGDSLRQAGRTAEAEATLRTAIEEGEQIVESDPSEMVMRRRLALAEINLGKVLFALDRPAEGQVALAKALDRLSALRRDDPRDLIMLVHHSRCLRFLATMQARLGRRDEAIQTWSEAIRILEQTSEEDRGRAVTIVSNMAVIYGDRGRLEYNAGRLADAEQTLLKAEDLARTYNGQAGRQRLDPYWLIWGRTRLGQVWMETGRPDQARDMFQKVKSTLAERPEIDGELETIAVVESALAELAGPSPERDEHDRKAADAFRRVVTAASPIDLTDLATDTLYARLRARPELNGLLLDRMFPSNPWAR
jgi:serine/threonine-protein kinase